MPSAADMRVIEDAWIHDLTGRAVELARDLHDQAMAAEDPQVQASLTTAFHTAFRSVRQGVALRRRVEREARVIAAAEAEDRMEARKAEVRQTISRLVWNEYDYEPCDAEAFLEDLELQLIIDDLDDHTPIEEHVARLRKQIGLTEPIPPPSGEGDREAVEGVTPDIATPHAPVIPESAQCLSGIQGPSPPPLDSGSPLQAARDDDEGWC